MSAPIWTPPVEPWVGSSGEVRLAVLTAEFGDGYRLDLAAGINTQQQSLSLQFNYITTAEAEAIKSFLIERGGWQSFWYRPPLEAEALLWKCGQWQEQYEGGGSVSLSLTLQRVYDHAA